MLADQIKGEDSFVTTKGINSSLKMNKQPYSTFLCSKNISGCLKKGNPA